MNTQSTSEQIVAESAKELYIDNCDKKKQSKCKQCKIITFAVVCFIMFKLSVAYLFITLFDDSPTPQLVEQAEVGMFYIHEDGSIYLNVDPQENFSMIKAYPSTQRHLQEVEEESVIVDEEENHPQLESHHQGKGKHHGDHKRDDKNNHHHERENHRQPEPVPEPQIFYTRWNKIRFDPNSMSIDTMDFRFAETTGVSKYPVDESETQVALGTAKGIDSMSTINLQASILQINLNYHETAKRTVHGEKMTSIQYSADRQSATYKSAGPQVNASQSRYLKVSFTNGPDDLLSVEKAGKRVYLKLQKSDEEETNYSTSADGTKIFFDKVLIDLQNMRIDTKDLTYSSHSGKEQDPSAYYGESHSCNGEARDANIDLRGTPFYIKSQFKPSKQEHVNFEDYFSYKKQVLKLKLSSQDCQNTSRHHKQVQKGGDHAHLDLGIFVKDAVAGKKLHASQSQSKDLLVDLQQMNWIIQDGHQYSLEKMSVDPRAMELQMSDLSNSEYTGEQRTDSFVEGKTELRVDLTGTPFIIDKERLSEPMRQIYRNENKIRGIFMIESSATGIQNIPVKIDQDELDKKYQFVYDYAPRIWLNEHEDAPWFPCTVEWHMFHTHPTRDDGVTRTTTNEPLEKKLQKLDFFHGQEPMDGHGAPVYTFIMPMNASESLDPLEILLNPESNSIQVTYIYFYAYDWVKYRVGDHVGDLEHSEIVFVDGKPTKIYNAQHSWGQWKEWGAEDLEMVENTTHPVGYSATGTHATYWSAGRQFYDKVIFDTTAQKQRWDTWNNLEIFFPWDYTNTERTVKNFDQWKDISYILNIQRWGNEGGPIEIAGESILNGGPSGFLDKGNIRARFAELEPLGYVCQGLDTNRCTWPAGPYSSYDPYCANGYIYSYQNQICQIAKFGKASCSCPKCEVDKPGSCGAAYTDQCSGSCTKVSCINQCSASQLTQPQGMVDHQICLKSNEWLSLSDYSNDFIDTATFRSSNLLHDDDSFGCAYTTY